LVSATRIWTSSSSGALFSPRIEQLESDSEVDNLGTFEVLAAMESAFPELQTLTERRTATMERMTELTQQATAELHQSDAAKRGFAGRLTLANKLAGHLSPVADELEEIATAYEDRVGRIDAGMTCLFESIEENPSQLKDMGTFPQSISTFASTIRQTNEQQAGFVSAMLAAGRFSKPLRIATRRIADATKRCSSALALAEVWSSRLEQLIDRFGSGKESAPTS
jgi:methyl-accepting chemotaxis protein